MVADKMHTNELGWQTKDQWESWMSKETAVAINGCSGDPFILGMKCKAWLKNSYILTAF